MFVYIAQLNCFNVSWPWVTAEEQETYLVIFKATAGEAVLQNKCIWGTCSYYSANISTMTATASPTLCCVVCDWIIEVLSFLCSLKQSYNILEHAFV